MFHPLSESVSGDGLRLWTIRCGRIDFFRLALSLRLISGHSRSRFRQVAELFPIQRCAIFRKEIGGIARRRTRVRLRLRTSDSAPTCHVFSVIDGEIAEKGHFWTETT
jgi:hypothetical protein